MSTFTPITLNGTVSSISGQLAYGENDGTGMSLQNQTYNITISVNAQSTGDGSSKKANEYNGIDVSEGMWMSDAQGQTILRIKSISAKLETIKNKNSFEYKKLIEVKSFQTPLAICLI